MILYLENKLLLISIKPLKPTIQSSSCLKKCYFPNSYGISR